MSKRDPNPQYEYSFTNYEDRLIRLRYVTGIALTIT